MSLITPNTIVCGDCLSNMVELPDDSVDITITSPPYNLTTRIGEGNLYDEYSDNLSEKEYQTFLYAVIDELLRINKYYVFFNIQPLSSNKLTVYNIFSKYKDYIKDVVIWAKTNSPPASEEGVLSHQFEFIFALSKYDRSGRKFNRSFFDNRNGGKNISNCIIMPMNKDNDCNEHKATFALWLPEFFILNFSKVDDLIFDPFMGTGTTAVVAKNNKRRYFGYELSSNYCDYANKRLSQSNISSFW